MLLGSGFAVFARVSYGMAEAFFTAEELVVAEVRIVVSAWRKVSTWPRKSARLVGYVSRTCSSASWWNPAAANASHVSLMEGKVAIVRAVSGNHRTSSMLSSLRFPEGSYLSGNPCG